MTEDLAKIAESLGIATHITDGGLVRQDYDVDPAIIRFFIKAFGYNVDSEANVSTTLKEIEMQRWKRVLDSVYVTSCGQIHFDFVTFADVADEELQIELTSRRDGAVITPQFNILPQRDEHHSNMAHYVKLQIEITSHLDIGYYDLKLKHNNKTHKTVLAVAPACCYEPEAMAQRLWGFAVQLYSVKSHRNWGVGDFTDLKTLVRICAEAGGAAIGLNPLNVLMHDFPENASPYQSISRLFLNPLYIDVEAVPEYEAADKEGLETTIQALRDSELIRYSDVYPLKMSILERCYQRFKDNATADRRRQYEDFCTSHQESLDKLAAFQTLYHQHCQSIWGGWQAWPHDLKNPQSPAVKKFVEKNTDTVGFFKFLQFEADRQFAEAAALVEELKLGIGFYRDLAVGVGKDSAELWSDPGAFIKGAGAGAPPDAFFPAGQKWGLGAFDPVELKRRAYQPFIDILRANMRSAGALRIDHVMSLMRLYVIPDHLDIGTYIYYNFEEMLKIVALESHLNHCAVVGESIGNVPEGFLSRMHDYNIRPLSVLWAERYNGGWGGFVAPENYPQAAFASVGTHDMAPLRMWWFGHDIELSYSLGLIANEQQKNEAYHKREADRWMLLQALDEARVWPEDNCRKDNYLYGEGYPEGIDEAVHRFMARTTSGVFLAQPEDILHVDKMQNLPGTDRDKHPNWRRKLPVSLEDLLTDQAFIRNIATIRKER